MFNNDNNDNNNNNSNCSAREFLLCYSGWRCCLPPKTAVLTQPALPLETSSRFTLDWRANFSLIGAAPGATEEPHILILWLES
eukprot:9458507-Pyramimonas_sp.AAC.1